MLRLADVLATFLRHSACPPYLAALSGGLDSCVLAAALSEIRFAEGWDFELAYFNHRLRDDESNDEERFCRDYAESLGVRLHVGSWLEPVPAEAAARVARYEWLSRVARSHGFGAILTAHHRRDQAETVLLRLLRGSGVRGLRAMAERSTVPGAEDLVLLRPLLRTPRAVLREFAEDRGLRWFEDSSNHSKHYLRNRVRRELLPLLEELRPGAERRLTELADIARLESAALEELIQDTAKRVVKSGPGWAVVSRRMLLGSPGIARRLVLEAWRRAQGTRLHSSPTTGSGSGASMRLPLLPRTGVLKAILKAVSDPCHETSAQEEPSPADRSSQRSFLLGPRSEVLVLPEVIVVLHGPPWLPPATRRTDTLPIDHPDLPEWLDVKVLPAEQEADLGPSRCDNQPEMPLAAASNGQRVSDASGRERRERNATRIDLTADDARDARSASDFRIRTRRPGDHLGPDGPRLKRLFIDRKLPRFLRDRYPLIEDERGLLFVPGLWQRPDAACPAIRFGPTWPWPLLPAGLNRDPANMVEGSSSLPEEDRGFPR